MKRRNILAWQIEFTATAIKQLNDFDKQIRRRIIKWLEDRILTTDDLRLWGAALTGDKGGKWRYRIGDYRVICEIQANMLIVRVVSVGNRNNIYK